MLLPAPVSMEWDDDDILDHVPSGDADDAPCFPPNLCFMMDSEDLAEADADGGSPGDTMNFMAMGEVTSVHASMTGCRIELELTQFAGRDGKFFNMRKPASICLCRPELAKMDLDEDCELGDLIHLIGEARLESHSKTEFGEMSCLQITKLTFEDESTEGAAR